VCCLLRRNQPDQWGRGGYNRQSYGAHSSRGRYDSNEQQWRGGNREGGGYHGGHYGRRDQFAPKDDYSRVHYAGVRERSGSDAPAPKYSRQINDRQSRH